MTSRIGIVGFGGFGKFLYQAWSKLDDVHVTAIADQRPIDAPEGVRVYRSWRDLLSDDSVDIVSVVTPPATHAEIAVAALNQGVHVLVEKPIAIDLNAAEAIVRARDASSGVATVDFMLRFNPIIACIQQWSHSRVFGSLQRVVVENYAQDESLDASHWFWDTASSGGILVEHGVHFFDIVNGCTSTPVRVVANRAWPQTDNRTDRVFSLVEYEDGVVATHYHAFNRLNVFERTSLRFVFDAAQIEVEGWIPMRGSLTALVGDHNREVLESLPNLEVIREERLDASRSTPLAASPMPQSPVDAIVTASFGLSCTKEEAYLDALRGIMSDVVSATRNREHPLRVTLEDGIAALRMALGMASMQ